MGTGATLTANDLIDLGAGSNDVVNVRSDGNATIPFLTLTGVETLNISSPGTVTSDTSGAFITGLNTVNSTGVGAATVTGKITQDLNVTTQTLANALIAVNAGKNVVVTATGATTSAATAGGDIQVGVTTAIKGTVAVTVTELATHTTNTSPTIGVKGGTTVSITQNLAGAVNNTITGGAVGVTGTADTTSVSVTQTAAATAAAAVSGVVNGAVTIADVNAGTATTDTITTVTLSSYGASTIDSTVLTNLTLGGTGGTLGINKTTSDTTGTATTLNLTVVGGAAVGAITGTHAADFTTVNVASTGTAASTISAATFAGATTIVATNAAKVTFTDNTLAALTSVNASGSTGGFVLGTTAINTGASFTGGSGADGVILGATTKAIAMNGGDDTVTITAAITGAGTVTGGDGIDTLVITDTLAGDTLDASGVFNSKVSGFERLQITAAGGNKSVDVTAINNVNYVKTAGVTGLSLENLASNSTLELSATSTSTTANILGAVGGTADVLNVALTGNVGAVVAYGTVTAPSVETVNISATDSATAGSAAAINTLTLAATGATSVVVTGNNGLTLTNTNNAAITNFDASAVVGNGTATVDTAANLAVTFLSANTTAAANVTIKGGAGNDVLTGSLSKDTISGNDGIDYIYGDNGGTKEVDTLTLTYGAGASTITIAGIASTYTAATDLAATTVLAAAAINANAALKGIASATSTATTVVITYAVDGDQVAPTGTGTTTGVNAETAAGTAGTAAVDSLNGGAGADLIVGGGGADVLTGGAGVDTFFFLTGHSVLASLATIADYTFATGGTSNDKLTLGNQVAAIGTVTTVQDLSALVSIQAAVDAAATANLVTNGLSVFIWGGNEYAYVESTAAGTSYVATDFIVKLTGLPLAAGATIAGSGFDAV